MFKEASILEKLLTYIIQGYPPNAPEKRYYKEYNPKYNEDKVLMNIYDLLSISIKDNKEIQVFAFKYLMPKLVKFLKLELPNKQEEQLLFDIINNCNDIFLEKEFFSIIFTLLKMLEVLVIFKLGN